MLVEITYLGDAPANNADAHDYVYQVQSWRDQQYVRRVAIRLDYITRVNVRSKLRGTDANSGDARVREAVHIVALRRLAALGRALNDPAGNALILNADYEELLAVGEDRKVCAHQKRRGSDLYCIAVKKPAPTTLHACESTCNLPDTRSLCSGFVHLEMAMAKTFPPAPIAGSRICEKGQQARIEEPAIRCTPGGHACWHRVIDLAPEPLDAALHPLAFNEALDFLSWVWRAKFPTSQTKLIHLGSSTAAAEVSQPCASAEAFRSRMNALADLLDSLKIDANLTAAPSHVKGTLNRLLDALRQALPNEEFERAEAAVGTLRSIVAIRTGLHHSDAGRETPAAARRLGLEWPPSDWSTTWQQVRDRGVRAIREVRQAIEATI